MGLGVVTASPSQAWRVAALSMMRKEDLHAILSGDPTSSARWVEAAAALGVPEAQVRLGRMLLVGEGVPKSEAAAAALFENAAIAGDAEAMNMLGRCYENGWGTDVDMARAAKCYSRAAGQGLDWAQYNYGHMLLDGQGVPRDRDQAFLWYMRAATQGHVRAMNLVGRCFEEGWGTERNARIAQSWYRKSAAGGYFRGAYNYASMLAADGCLCGAHIWFARALSTALEPTRTNIRKALSRHSDPAIRALAVSA